MSRGVVFFLSQPTRPWVPKDGRASSQVIPDDPLSQVAETHVLKTKLMLVSNSTRVLHSKVRGRHNSQQTHRRCRSFTGASAVSVDTSLVHSITGAPNMRRNRKILSYVTCLNMSRIVLMRSRYGLLLGHEILHAGATPRDVRDYRVQLVKQGPASGLHQFR